MLPEISGAEHETIRRHYAHVTDTLVRHFGGTPVAWVTFPRQLGIEPVYHKSLDDAPATIATIAVRTSTGMHPYAKLDAHNLTWIVTGRFAVEILGWSPTLDDPDRAAFARLVLSPQGRATDDDAAAAALVARDALARAGLEAFPMLDGFRGLTLWIPFSDGPSYDAVGAWIRGFAADLAAAQPQTLTVAAHVADRGDRVMLGTKSNHPGMGSILPYALRGTPSLEVALPIGWHDLGKVHNGEVTAANYHAYVRMFGDVFARERHAIPAQALGTRGVLTLTPTPTYAIEAPELDAHGYIITAALRVLADGAAHDADDILAQAQALGLLPTSTTRKYVYTALHEYVERTRGAGREPEFVQVAGAATFRLNRPADPWPATVLPPLPSWIAPDALASATAALRATATGGDPAAFERATTDAFASLGFVATHVGGNGEPDVTLVAPLGARAYAAIVECKTASVGGIVANPRPEEPARFRDAAGARFAVLVGPAFGGDAALDDELRAHGVALWTVDDLARVLQAQIGPEEMSALFAPGRVAGALRDLLWEREHGARKRVAATADAIHRALWDAQRTLASLAAATAPRFDRETVALLADESLVRAGVVAGAATEVVDRALEALIVQGRVRYDGETGYVAAVPAPTNIIEAVPSP